MASDDGRLTRRELLLTGAAAAGYALAAGPVSAERITTSGQGLVAGLVSIPSRAGDLPAYRARPPDAHGLPVVLVAHEIFGVHEYIRDVCRRLALAGYLAIAPDLYQRFGDVTKLASVGEIIDSVVAKVPDEGVMSDLDATVAWASEEGGDAERVAITGFCWGGRIVWLYAAHSEKLRAGAAWYGRFEGAAKPETPQHPLELGAKLHAPVLGLYGAADRGIPATSVAAMKAVLADSRSPSEIVLFPGAPHGFHADYRPSYRALAAEEGWRRMLAWFRDRGV